MTEKTIIKIKKFKPVFLIGFIIILSFLMVMSPWANLDNPILCQNTGVRYGLIESELTGYNMFNKVFNKSIRTDELPVNNLQNIKSCQDINSTTINWEFGVNNIYF